MNDNKGFNYAFGVSRHSLRIFGVWPDPLVSLSDFHRPSIRFIIAMSIVLFYAIMPTTINTIRAWGNVIRMVEGIATTNFCMLALCKIFGTWYHRKTLRTLMTSIMTDWTSKNNEERNTMLHITRRGRILCITCYAMMIILISFFINSNLIKIFRNISQPQRTLVYPFNYFYNSQKSPNYEITCLFQLIAGACSCFINSSIDVFISLLLLHICAQLINLRMALNNLVDKLAEGSISSSSFKKGLAEITTRHEHLIRNTKIVNNCYSIILFLHMFATTFQLCFKSFQFFTIIIRHLDVPIITKIYALLYFIYELMHLYIYCYSAERLLTESVNMMHGAYECKWYDLPSKDAKNLIFMIRRSAIPFRLKAGKFGTFSIEMFGNVRYLKRKYSIFHTYYKTKYLIFNIQQRE
ncbi:odorant receptor 22c-like isoform X1 [Solenopsis invicta]|uniref:odorant receptor 22c-like isoform X1 n=1 Tax=Solenopsis invicta TaxID=13686 RepID=UPI00193DA9E6|nr:odorant receptor 22c-like isoform X1 [Solenopsis invicta]